MIGEGASHDGRGTGKPSSPISGLAVPELSHDVELGQALDRCSRYWADQRENENRPDRGWQKAGDVALSVVKAAVVTGAIRGFIPPTRRQPHRRQQ